MRFHCDATPRSQMSPHLGIPGPCCMQIVTPRLAGQPILGRTQYCPFHVLLWLCLGLGSPAPHLGVQSDRGPSQARRWHRNKFAAFFKRLSHDLGVMIFMTPCNWWCAGAYLMEVGGCWQGQVWAAARSPGAQSSTPDGHYTLGSFFRCADS